MKKLSILFLFLLYYTSAQTTSRWRDHFSYFNIYDVIDTPDKLICSSENGLFTVNKTTNEVTKISKANGLNGVRIAAIAYNTKYDYIFVSYQNGALNIIKPDGIEYMVDIPIDTDFNGDKAINHIYSDGDNAVFSMDFGVVLYNIPRLEVDETTYFKNNGNYVVVNESVILNNAVYAGSDIGVYSHPINNAIPFFPAWTSSLSGNAIQQMELFNSKIFAASNGIVYQSSDGISWQNFATFSNLKDINATETHLSFIFNNSIQNYDSSLNSIGNIAFSENLNTGIYSNTLTYGGSQLSGLINGTTQEKLFPDGPYKNNSYHLSLLDDKIWIAPGGREGGLIFPNNNTDGYFYFNGNNWEHISFLDLNSVCCIMDVIPNPSNPDEQYATSYGNGAIKLDKNEYVESYNNTNSTIVDLPWMVGGNYDSKGNLILTQTFYKPPVYSNAIHFITPGNQWNAIDFATISNGNYVPQAAINYPTIDSKNWVWAPSPRGDGLVVYNYNDTPNILSDDKSFVLLEIDGKGKLPTNRVNCVELDKNDTAWIGTQSGLRILKNPHTTLLEENYNTEFIIIEQNNIPAESLKDIEITAIKTDEANRKWIGTKNNGVFYVSPNGELILEEFNATNSPLPSNQINDIKIDKKTGWVYFATLYGVVSYKSDITEAGDNFGNVLPYPNPVRPGFYGNVVIKGLANNAKVKITDTNGNLVSKGTAVGGIYEWDQRNLKGNLVTSGIYLVLLSNADNTEVQSTKIAIVR